MKHTRAPVIPAGLMQKYIELRYPEPTLGAYNGGQVVKGKPDRVEFLGALLPMSEEDLRRAQQGTYTHDTRKLYTNGHILGVGGMVENSSTRERYQVKSCLDHGELACIKRYIVERKGGSC